MYGYIIFRSSIDDALLESLGEKSSLTAQHGHHGNHQAFKRVTFPIQGAIMANSNVTPITEKQPAPAAKFTIQATIGGFPVTIEGEGRAGDLRAIVDRLKAIGAEPPAAQVAPAAPSSSSTPPLCPVHHSEMKSGKRGWFCPRKVEDGGYCRATA